LLQGSVTLIVHAILLGLLAFIDILRYSRQKYILKCGANPNEKLEGSGEFRNALVAAMSPLSTAGTAEKKAWERAKAIHPLVNSGG